MFLGPVRRPLPARRLSSLARSGRKAAAKPEILPSAELPTLDKWKTAFPYHANGLKDRVSVKNPVTADKLAKSFIYWNWNKMDAMASKGTEQEVQDSEKNMEEVEQNSISEPDGKQRGKVVIEAYPGPGALTRALMRLPKERIRKLIVLENDPNYYDWLKPLEEVDSRVKIVQHSGFSWETYEIIEELGLLDDVKKAPWESVHPDLQFITHVPTNIPGEQLVAQFFRCIPDQQWLFKYGRVPMSIILGAWMWKRVSAPAGVSERCKVSVISEATASFSSSLPLSALTPYQDHFHPVFIRESKNSKPEHRRHGSPVMSINILPFVDQVIEKGALDKWDFCLRRLFVLKSQGIGKAIGSLAPGSNTLLKYLSDETLPASERLDLNTQVRKLTVYDWSLVLRAFERWPFAPQDLLITDAFTIDTDRGKSIYFGGDLQFATCGPCA